MPTLTAAQVEPGLPPPGLGGRLWALDGIQGDLRYFVEDARRRQNVDDSAISKRLERVRGFVGVSYALRRVRRDRVVRAFRARSGCVSVDGGDGGRRNRARAQN